MHTQNFSDEVPFAFDELFFSRTDPHGIIVSGNAVFQRVSGYPWNELLRKPHKTIRHPDMPRAVFWLLWDTIKRNEAIGAYVLNRAKDGRRYWVFALVTPVDGGFLSVRLKPSSPLFAAIRQEYAALLEREQSENPTPAASAARLLARLKELGFRDYASFMSAALAAEIAARNAQLGQPPVSRMARFADLTAASKALLEHANSIFAAYASSAYVSLNFQVQAAKLGQAGAAIGEISKNYDLISAEIRDNMERFIAAAEQVAATVNTGQFLLYAAQLQSEVRAYFEREVTDESGTRDRDMALLDGQMSAYRQKAADGLHRISVQAAGFRGEFIDMKRLATGLEVTRIMGKVESARLHTLQHGLDGLIDELETLQRAIGTGLKAIDQLSQRIQHDTDGLLSETGASLPRAA